MALITAGQAITQPTRGGTNQFDLVRRQTCLFPEFTIHRFLGGFVGVHATLRKLPAVVTGALRPEYTSVLVHQDDSDIWSVPVRIDHAYCLFARNGACNIFVIRFPEC